MSRDLKRSSDYITRAECQALFVHMMNEVFSGAAAEPAPYQDVNTSDVIPAPAAYCELCDPLAGGFYAGPDCGHKVVE